MLRRLKYIGIVLVIISLTIAFADDGPTNQLNEYETKEIIKNEDLKQVIYETQTLEFSFKDKRDILYIHDKSNDYVWQSGLDIASSKEVKKALRNDEPLGLDPLEQKMNQTYTDIANSLIVVEYYDESLSLKRLSSASDEAQSTLKQVLTEEGHFVLETVFEEMNISINTHILLSETGYTIEIYEEEIKGSDKERIAAIMLNPFLGASGGEYALYDPETGEHGDVVKKPKVEGYVLVADGPGALIHFNDYNVSLKDFTAKVYGPNLSKGTYHESEAEVFHVPFKTMTMPVYGMAHTTSKAAFIGYASKGDAHMEIVVMPEENTTLYTWAYPRFVKNDDYYQVFNKRGEGYFSLFEVADQYDIKFTYEFIAESEEMTADYSGMAKTYQNRLLEQGILVGKDQDDSDVPMRIDFVMSDPKKSVLGFEDVVVTSTEDVAHILDQLKKSGVNNINSGLYGWQEGGITTGQPWQTNWHKDIGRKSDFEELIKDSDFDISFAQNYLTFTDEKVKVQGNAIKHINNWYLNINAVGDIPFLDFYFAKPTKSIEWLDEQLSKLSKLGIASHTVEGISSALYTEHGRHPLQEEDVINMYTDALNAYEMKFNFKAPNQYLWSITDRFLQAPVFPTRYLIETETVPFLQMVTNQSMEVYSPYSNFSFSDTTDVLKMIDYNVYPSFVLTKSPSYLLSSTNSSEFYSTEYEQYEELIPEVYEQVNKALKHVKNTKWMSREKIARDVFVNTYENGSKIVINYSSDEIMYMDTNVNAQSFRLLD